MTSKLAPMEAKKPPTFRVEVRVRNNRILKAIERLGYKNQADACKAIHYHPTTLATFVTFRRSPISRYGDGFTAIAKELAEKLYCDPEDLWPDEARAVKKARASFEATFEDLRALGAAGEHDFERKLLLQGDTIAVKEAFAALDPREREVIEARFIREETLEEVGEKLCRNRETVRVIETSALRKMRKALEAK